MIKFLCDENLNNNIVRGLARRDSSLTVVRVLDAGLGGAADPVVLEFAAGHGLIVVSHDVSTLTRHAYDRIAGGLAMPGLFEVPEWMAVGAAIEDLLLIAGASDEAEWDRRVLFLPLR